MKWAVDSCSIVLLVVTQITLFKCLGVVEGLFHYQHKNRAGKITEYNFKYPRMS